MRLHVNLKFNSKEREHIVKFADEVGLSVDDFCKRAVFYSINDAYRRAEQQAQEMENGNTKHDSPPGNSDGNNQEEQLLGSTASAALSNQTDAPIDSQA